MHSPCDVYYSTFASSVQVSQFHEFLRNPGIPNWLSVKLVACFLTHLVLFQRVVTPTKATKLYSTCFVSSTWRNLPNKFLLFSAEVLGVHLLKCGFVIGSVICLIVKCSSLKRIQIWQERWGGGPNCGPKLAKLPHSTSIYFLCNKLLADKLHGNWLQTRKCQTWQMNIDQQQPLSWNLFSVHVFVLDAWRL